MNPHRSLDALDWQIIVALQEDGRSSWSELGRRVGLSQPAVAERVRRLEEAGIIEGYHASVNPALLGLPLAAYVRLRIHPGSEERLYEAVARLPSVLECHRVTGDDCLFLKVIAPTIQALEVLLDQLKQYGITSTHIILSSVVARRTIGARGSP